MTIVWLPLFSTGKWGERGHLFFCHLGGLSNPFIDLPLQLIDDKFADFYLSSFHVFFIFLLFFCASLCQLSQLLSIACPTLSVQLRVRCSRLPCCRISRFFPGLTVVSSRARRDNRAYIIRFGSPSRRAIQR